MRKLENVIAYVQTGSIIQIEKQGESYQGIFIKYDGGIFKDVFKIELPVFLDEYHHVKELLDKGYLFQLSYDYEKEEYQANMMLSQKEKESEDNYRTFNETPTGSMIDLEDKIRITSITTPKELFPHKMKSKRRAYGK